MAAWNYVETGPAQAGAPGGLQPEGPGEQDYVEFLPFQEASGNGPFRVDSSGNMTVNGLAALKGGSDTSATATVGSPSFSSGVSLQLNTTQDVMLYIAITTSAALAVAIGPLNTVTTALIPSASYALSVISIRVPKGWWVKITGTIADTTITSITC